MKTVVRFVLGVSVLALPAINAGAQPAPPALPQVFLDTTYPTQTGQVVTINQGGNLQAAIDNANPGDTIQLQAGATFTGTFTLRKKSNPNHKWIVIRSASSVFDTNGSVPPGTRVNGADSNQTTRWRRLSRQD